MIKLQWHSQCYLQELLPGSMQKIVDGIVNGSASLTYYTSKFSGKFDNYFVDTLVNLAGGFAGFFGLIFRKVQTGKIQTYLAFAVFGILILYFVLRVI